MTSKQAEEQKRIREIARFKYPQALKENEEFKARIASLQEKVLPQNNQEMALNPEDLRMFRWLKTLDDTEESLKYIEYMYADDRLSEKLAQNIWSKRSPFYLPIGEKWHDKKWKDELTPIQREYRKLILEKQKSIRDVEVNKKLLDVLHEKIEKTKKEYEKKMQLVDHLEKRESAVQELQVLYEYLINNMMIHQPMKYHDWEANGVFEEVADAERVLKITHGKYGGHSMIPKPQ